MKNKKTCPRCKQKCFSALTSCPNCQLNFSKFNEATNREAKQAIREHRAEDCVMRIGCPSDVKRLKLIILTVFLGLVGVHNYYVGRFARGIVFSIFFVIGVINTILSFVIPNSLYNGDLGQLFYLLVLCWGIVIIMWIFDIFNVIFNRFKIPVSRSV